MGALRGEADDPRGVIDTVVLEPPVNTKMSIISKVMRESISRR